MMRAIGKRSLEDTIHLTRCTIVHLNGPCPILLLGVPLPMPVVSGHPLLLIMMMIM